MAQVEQNPTVSAVKTVEKLPASFKEADVAEDFLLPSCILTVVAGIALFSESYFVDQVEKPEAALAPLNVPAAHSPESR